VQLCQRREVVYLDELQVEIFRVRKCIARVCQLCDSPSIWIEIPIRMRDPENDAPGTAVERTRSFLAATARHQSLRPRSFAIAAFKKKSPSGEDLSKGGLSFAAAINIPKARVEVAVPFTPGTGAIFVPIRIVFSQAIPPQASTATAPAYIKPPLDI